MSGNDSATDSLQSLRQTQQPPTRHAIAKKEDPTPGPLSKSDDDDHDGDVLMTDNNNYHTWNSYRMNAAVYNEMTAVLSALRAADASSCRSSPPPGHRSSSWSQHFDRSHRVRDIVAMCSEGAAAFSADEYRDDDWWPEHYDAARRGCPCRNGCDRNSRCWSCAATDGSDNDGGNGGRKNDSFEDGDDDDDHHRRAVPEPPPSPPPSSPRPSPQSSPQPSPPSSPPPSPPPPAQRFAGRRKLGWLLFWKKRDGRS